MLHKAKYLLLVIGLLFLIPACATDKPKEYSGCSGLRDLIPELAIDSMSKLQIWEYVEQGRDDICNTLIEQLNTPQNLKSYYTDEAVAKRKATEEANAAKVAAQEEANAERAAYKAEREVAAAKEEAAKAAAAYAAEREKYGYSEGQIDELLLSRNEFPKDWVVSRNGETEVEGNLTYGFVSQKTVKISLSTHDNTQEDFQSEKTEIQSKINARGISGDAIQEIYGYDMFVWLYDGVPSYGYEHWQVIGVYGNVMMHLDHTGTLYATDKDIAISLAKKQMDKIMGTTPIPEVSAVPNVEAKTASEKQQATVKEKLVENARPTIESLTIPLISLDIEAEFEMELGNTELDSHSVVISWGDDSPISTYSLGPGENTLSFKHTYTVGTDGKPYRVAIEVTDEGGQWENTDQLVYFKESFIISDNPIPDSPGNDYSVRSLSINIPEVGFFTFFDGHRVKESYKFDGSWNTISKPDRDILTICCENYRGAAAIALNDSQIFVLGSKNPNTYSNVGIYDIPSDSWTYPIAGKTPYELTFPALHLLDNGHVLIVGGLKSTSKGRVPNELTLIYDPISQSIYSGQDNPLTERFANALGPPTGGWNETSGPNSSQRSYLLGLPGGDILLLETNGVFDNKGLATIFDPVNNVYTPISGDSDVTYFDYTVCEHRADKVGPLVLSDGRIFLGSAIISSDLSSVEPIDFSNIGGRPCKFYNPEDLETFSNEIRIMEAGKILLPDDKILFVTPTTSLLFDGNSYRPTKYQLPDGAMTTKIFFDTQGQIIIFDDEAAGEGATDFNNMIEFKYSLAR